MKTDMITRALAAISKMKGFRKRHAISSLAESLRAPAPDPTLSRPEKVEIVDLDSPTLSRTNPKLWKQLTEGPCGKCDCGHDLVKLVCELHGPL